jgi:uncharacterized protein YkwD
MSRLLAVALAALSAACTITADTSGEDAAHGAASDAGSIAKSDASPAGASDAATTLAVDASTVVAPDAGAASQQAHIQHCLDQLNAYRAQAGAPALTLDDDLNAFALAGSQELMQDHSAHAHFKADSSQLFALGFHSLGENQGDPNGWMPMDEDAAIDSILSAMMAEGPGGGHHDNILSTGFSVTGVGLIEDPSGRLYFTNDFGGY